jgi:hypothetical protein
MMHQRNASALSHSSRGLQHQVALVMLEILIHKIWGFHLKWHVHMKIRMFYCIQFSLGRKKT